jgi:hypothetical protein
MVGSAGTELALARRDDRLAGERGDLAGQVRAETARNAFARSMPFGIGQLGGNIRELITGEQAGIDRTNFEAQQGNQKADFWQRINERNAAARDSGKAAARAEAARKAGEVTPELGQALALRGQISDLQEKRKGLSGEGLAGIDKEIAALSQHELELRSTGAAKIEQLEREHNRAMLGMQDQYAAEVLTAQGKTEEASMASFVAGLKAQERALENAIEEAGIKGDHAAEKRLTSQRAPLAAMNAALTANFQRAQDRAWQERQGAGADARWGRIVAERQRDEARVMEGRARGREALGVEQGGRQIFLRSKSGQRVGGALRADMEQLRDQFRADMEDAVVRETDKEGKVTVTPNEQLRTAITKRFREQISSLIEANERVTVSGESTSSAAMRSLGSRPGGDGVERTLKGDILTVLKQIRDRPERALTS